MLTDTAEQPFSLRGRRNRALGERDWEENRQLITFLYKNKGMKLEDLMSSMRKSRNFDATRSMYLRRINQWNIKKNFKASQKQSVLERLGQSITQPLSYTSCSIPLHRIRRYERELLKTTKHRHQAALCDGMRADLEQSISDQIPGPHLSTVSSVESVHNTYVSNTVMTSMFIYSPGDRLSELFLVSLREYMRSCIPITYLTGAQLSGTRNIRALLDPPHSVIRLNNHLVLAETASTARHSAQMDIWLNEACGLANEVLRSAHWSLIILFGALQRLWDCDPDSGSCVNSVLLRKAETVSCITPRHCVTQLFRSFSQIPRADVLDRAGSIVLDTIHQLTPNNGLVSAWLGSYMVIMYRNSGLKYSALNMAKRNKRICHERSDGQSHELTQRATVDLASAYLQCDDFDHARQEAHTMLVSEQAQNLPAEVIMQLCLTAGNSCLALGLLEDARQTYSSSAHLVQSRPLDEVGLKRLMYCKRMICNIRRTQAVASGYDGHDAGYCYQEPISVSCRLADEEFSRWAREHGWLGV